MPRALLPILAALLLAPSLHAQEPLPRPRPSQHGTVSQEVALTTITVVYDRPVARGRDLYGGIVLWDSVSTPGANRATWVEFSTPVTFAGQSVPAGRYGLWQVPHASGSWELILVRDWDRFHKDFPAATELLRVRITPVRGEHIETLTWDFPEVADYETVLRLHWGTTMLPIKIEVPREALSRSR